MGEDKNYKRYVDNFNFQCVDIGVVYRPGGDEPKNLSGKIKKIYLKCKKLSEENNGVSVMVLDVDKKNPKYILGDKRQLRPFFDKEKGLSRLFLSTDLGLSEEKSRDFSSSKTIQSRLSLWIFGILAIAGLFFGFSSLTGATIGFSKSVSLPIGVLLFVLGILGLFFGRKL
jgi:hypothetical protein